MVVESRCRYNNGFREERVCRIIASYATNPVTLLMPLDVHTADKKPHDDLCCRVTRRPNLLCFRSKRTQLGGLRVVFGFQIRNTRALGCLTLLVVRTGHEYLGGMFVGGRILH
jgi:hypothetical protein